MADLLRIGSTSLLHLQHALSTTGHNIANVNTAGYSRQTVNFTANGYQGYGFGFVGQGAAIGTVERAYNGFITSQQQNYTASASRYETQLSYLARLDDIMSNAKNSLNSSLQDFFNGVQEVSANPAGLPERQLLLADAQNLVNRQQSMNAMFTELNKEVNSELRSIVSQINGYADSISLLNKEIVSALASNNGAPPNDLLDKRDLLIKELASKVAVKAVEQDDGSMNIFIGRGQAMVVGTNVSHLKTIGNPYDPSRLEIGLEGNKVTGSISHLLDGGALQGLLDFRNQNLDAAQAQAGLIMLSLTAAFNEQHRLGMDLNGEQGADFFVPQTVQVLPHASNAGSGGAGVTVTDATQVQASDYRVSWDGSAWTVTRLSDGGTASGAGPLTIDGMTIALSGTPQAGDSFMFNPARDAGNGFGLALQDARKFAAAASVHLQTPAGNNGTGSLQDLKVTDASAMPLTSPLVITFSPDALGPGVPGFLVNGGADGTLAYDPATESDGKDFALPAFGLSFRMSGTPQDGDSFTISDNSGARGDNGNALALAALQKQDLVSGRSATFQEYYSALVADVGISTRETTASHEVESSLLEQVTAYREGISGVNLDEEASNMLRLQQAYQASAQMVKVAEDLFDVLMNSIR